ncbi:MAG: hypothetical protein IKV16_07205 [Clostridia bacterium]|nr:hypothetical protein [Clostridia bacterium]
MSQGARYSALVGMMAATIECTKLILSGIPNIEGVSLLIAVYSFVFGWAGVAAAVVFVCIEPLVWGFGTWFISYMIYWPAVALIFFLLGRLRIKRRFIATGVITVMTFLFGVLTSLVDIGLFSGSFDRFFYRFGIYYARGVVFYAVHIMSNFLVFLILFPPVVRLLEEIKSRIFK